MSADAAADVQREIRSVSLYDCDPLVVKEVADLSTDQPGEKTNLKDFFFGSIPYLRRVVFDSVAACSFETARFFSQKLVSASNGAPSSVYLLAYSLFRSREYRRCLHALEFYGLVRVPFRRFVVRQTAVVSRNASTPPAPAARSSSRRRQKAAAPSKPDTPSAPCDDVRVAAFMLHLRCFVLAAQAIMELRNYNKALELLGGQAGPESAVEYRLLTVYADLPADLSSSAQSSQPPDHNQFLSSCRVLLASVALHRAKCLLALEDRPGAQLWFVECLFRDVSCTEAVTTLLSAALMSRTALRKLLDSPSPPFPAVSTLMLEIAFQPQGSSGEQKQDRWRTYRTGAAPGDFLPPGMATPASESKGDAVNGSGERAPFVSGSLAARLLRHHQLDYGLPFQICQACRSSPPSTCSGGVRCAGDRAIRRMYRFMCVPTWGGNSSAEPAGGEAGEAGRKRVRDGSANAGNALVESPTKKVCVQPTGAQTRGKSRGGGAGESKQRTTPAPRRSRKNAHPLHAGSDTLGYILGAGRQVQRILNSASVDREKLSDEAGDPTQGVVQCLDVDTGVALARVYATRFQYDLSLQITSRLLSQSLFHPNLLALHIINLYECQRISSLFSVAHQLMSHHNDTVASLQLAGSADNEGAQDDPTGLLAPPNHTPNPAGTSLASTQHLRVVNKVMDSAVAWFAVGVYYFALGKYDVSRRLFRKSIQADSNFVEGWVGLGHSFAALDGVDQALSVYRVCRRLRPGAHWPYLYMACAYMHTNAVVLAEELLKLALERSAVEPSVWNELGVLHYRCKRFEKAAECFERVVELVQNTGGCSVQLVEDGNDASSIASSRADDTEEEKSVVARNAHRIPSQSLARLLTGWEASIFNLGHCYRKLGQYRRALYWYKICLSLCSGSKAFAHRWSVHTAIGFTLHLLALQVITERAERQAEGKAHDSASGDQDEQANPRELLDSSITWYHNSLGLRRRNNLTHDLLTVAMKDSVQLPM